MEEIRVYSGFLGMERNKRAGHSMEMKPEARVACQVMLAVLFTALLITAIAFAVQAFQPHAQPCFQCPFDWIRYRGKCYYFSEVEGNWTYSQDNCSALGASLAMLDSTEDLSFVMRYKGISEHWIGLLREDEGQPWMWVNRSPLSHLFWIRGSGLCAYLDDNGLSSSHCSTERSWICNKDELQSSGKGNRMRRPPNLCVSSLGAAGRPSHSQISGAPQGHERKSQEDFEIPGQGVIGVSRSQQSVSGTRQTLGIPMR